MKYIMLHGRDGAVRERVLVDAEDAERFGKFRWALAGNGYAVGTLSTGRYKREYQRGPRVGGPLPKVYLHRLIAGVETGDGSFVDHINRDRLDCRRSNLRVVDARANAQNQTAQAGCTSRHRGVAFNRRRGKWIAYGTVAGKRVYLGCAFEDEDEAGAAAAEFRRQHMPFSEEAMA